MALPVAKIRLCKSGALSGTKYSSYLVNISNLSSLAISVRRSICWYNFCANRFSGLGGVFTHTYIHTYVHTELVYSQYTRNAQYQTCFAGFDKDTTEEAIPEIYTHSTRAIPQVRCNFAHRVHRLRRRRVEVWSLVSTNVRTSRQLLSR